MILNDMTDLKQIKLAQAYVPYQEYKNLYSVEDALYKGTIFADLYRPYTYKKKYKPLK